MGVMEHILREKKMRRLSWNKLAENLPINGDSLRIAFNRGKVDNLYLEILLKELGLKTEQTEKNVVVESSPIYNKNGNGFVELPDGTFDIEVKEVPFSAYASYVESCETGTIKEDFNTVVFNVDRYGRGNYMAFVVKGDSMNGGKIDDTPDGAKVLGRELGKHHWKDGFHFTNYGWIILSKQNIFHKDIIDYNSENGEIKCHSRNESPEYSDFILNLNDCYQIFKVIKRIF